MECKINVPVALATGGTVTGSIVRFVNGIIDLDKARFVADAFVWRSQAIKDSGARHDYFKKGNGLEYTIPEDVITEMIAEDEYTPIGAHHKGAVVAALAALLGIEESDIEVTTLL